MKNLGGFDFFLQLGDSPIEHLNKANSFWISLAWQTKTAKSARKGGMGGIFWEGQNTMKVAKLRFSALSVCEISKMKEIYLIVNGIRSFWENILSFSTSIEFEQKSSSVSAIFILIPYRWFVRIMLQLNFLLLYHKNNLYCNNYPCKNSFSNQTDKFFSKIKFFFRNGNLTNLTPAAQNLRVFFWKKNK